MNLMTAESDLEDDNLYHRFGGEYIVPQATVNMVNGTPRGAVALATFTFNYRPFGASLQLSVL